MGQDVELWGADFYSTVYMAEKVVTGALGFCIKKGLMHFFTSGWSYGMGTSAEV
jgi:hypothetical protein